MLALGKLAKILSQTLIRFSHIVLTEYLELSFITAICCRVSHMYVRIVSLHWYYNPDKCKKAPKI